MDEFKEFKRTQISEMRKVSDKDINIFKNHGFIHISEYPFGNNISISDADKNNGSPKIGDMIARNPKDYADQWLVAEQYYKDNFALMDNDTTAQLKADKAELLEALENIVDYGGIANFDTLKSLIQKMKKCQENTPR